ncbi:HNH endonuclease [Lachnospiraceae bacterium]|nr:HNH endonuclease [Lachnospiraceae bacterium]
MEDILQVLGDEYQNTLDLEGFSNMMKNPSYCYKFYWLEAIVNLISEGVVSTTFNDIIDEMIANAWYSVVEFHIHLSGVVAGDVRDGLERAVIKLHDLSKLSSNASKLEIRNAIKEHDKELNKVKSQLTNMVPYRALAGFFIKSDEIVNWDSIPRLVAYIQDFDKKTARLPYVLGTSPGLKKEVFFNLSWMKMIQDNTVPILGWIQYEKVKWLQNNNPEVPGLVYKLAPLNDKMRKLSKVRDLWTAVMTTNPIHDVFNDSVLDINEYDVDHFVPWSFVMNDELWNLMPMDSSLNSSKSNKLPKWDPFFRRFAANQFLMYEEICDKESIRKLFEKCYKDNLHSIWANQELYRQGNSKDTFYNILETNMRPVYESARRQGYQLWEI